MRGKLRGECTGLEKCRLIPAHAGKTLVDGLLAAEHGAHPRACGENQRPWPDPGSCDGSSPRMRGKRVAAEGLHRGRRLIPAHAGKTCPRAASQWLARAHPRACGENRDAEGVKLLEAGSSPRMRGKPAMPETVRSSERLIPAHAGKTPLPRPATRPKGAHPRACGENGHRR